MIYFFLIVLLSFLSTSTASTSSGKAASKWDGDIRVVHEFPPTGDPKDGMEKVKVTRKFDKGTNSSIEWEGEPVTLYCNLTRPGENSTRRGVNPYNIERFRVAWRLGTNGAYLNAVALERRSERYNYTETDPRAPAFPPHQTKLTILKLNASLDKGFYQCALYDANVCPNVDPAIEKCIVSSFEIQLRIKVQMDKIYPFISIAVEVVLLLIIIVVYEKRKSKTEVEESDTDGSPDQKNVSDNNGEGVSEATRLAKD